jgi:5-oxoprolinase (ATP-hydrolysing) subunit C
MSARALSVLRGGALSSVVDRGRFGHRGEGVPCGGPLDALAYATANQLAGCEPGAAAVEVTFGDFAVRFECEMRFALAGADCGADLDGARVDAWGSYEASAGAILTLRRPRAGARTYLAVGGGVDVALVLDSRTTNLVAGFGGFEGRALRAGDRLPVGGAARTFARGARPRCKPPQWDFARDAFERPEMPLRLLSGGEYGGLSAAARERFWASVFTIGTSSDRMGARLASAVPVALDAAERPSHAVFPGVVQLPPSGEPIVLLADAQATGGYPKLGAVIAADLWKIGQLGAGARLRFVPSSLDEAARARREIGEYLKRVEAATG